MASGAGVSAEGQTETHLDYGMPREALGTMSNVHLSPGRAMEQTVGQTSTTAHVVRMVSAGWLAWPSQPLFPCADDESKTRFSTRGREAPHARIPLMTMSRKSSAISSGVSAPTGVIQR